MRTLSCPTLQAMVESIPAARPIDQAGPGLGFDLSDGPRLASGCYCGDQLRVNQISIWSYKGIIRLHGFRLKVCSHDRFGKSVTYSTCTHGKYLPMLETPRPFMKEQHGIVMP